MVNSKFVIRNSKFSIGVDAMFRLPAEMDACRGCNPSDFACFPGRKKIVREMFDIPHAAF
jgi:hypothetical protein